MKALIVVDVQNDFCPGGALPVPLGDEVVPIINSLTHRFDCVVATQDWHPVNHVSFASRHQKQAGDAVETADGSQILWPDHCVQGQQGSQFHPELRSEMFCMILRKGMNRERDSYSAFYENDQATPTGLSSFLRERRIREVFLCGLATDYCVYYSALDAIREGWRTTVITDACRGVGQPEGSESRAWKTMAQQGITLIESAQLPG